MRLPKLFKNKYYLGLLFLIGAFFVYFIFRQFGYRMENMDTSSKTREQLQNDMVELDNQINGAKKAAGTESNNRCLDESKECKDSHAHYSRFKGILDQLENDKKKLQNQIDSTPLTSPVPTPDPNMTNLADRVSRLERDQSQIKSEAQARAEAQLQALAQPKV